MNMQSQECTEVLRSWNRCHGAFYQATESDLQWNLSEQKMIRYRADLIEGTPVILAEAAPDGVAEGILPQSLWVSLFGELAEGRESEFASAATLLPFRPSPKRTSTIGPIGFNKHLKLGFGRWS